jgi:hypothetical protein
MWRLLHDGTPGHRGRRETTDWKSVLRGIWGRGRSPLAVRSGSPVIRCALARAVLAWLASVGTVLAQTATTGTALRESVDYRRSDLEQIVDFTGLDRPEERSSYFGMLDHARSAPLPAQRRRARELLDESRRALEGSPERDRGEFKLFAHVVSHPERYRGAPVTLLGRIRRLETLEAGDNDAGLTRLYQVYLYTDDSRPLPWVVVATAIPDDLPRPEAGRPVDHITVTGYLHKLWSYDTDEGRWAAPLILAGRLEYRPPPPAVGWLWWEAGVVSVFVLGTVLLVVISRRAGGRRRRLDANRTLSSEPVA